MTAGNLLIYFPMKIYLSICALAGTLLLPAGALAQNYNIDWYKIAGGGVTTPSTGGVYTVSGTIGQPDASSSMTGGNYSLTGGFWSMISVIQSAGVPNLTVRQAGNSVIVAWPNTGSYTLLQSASLPGGWTTNSYLISTANGTNSITISSPTGNLFFRLK